MGDTPPYEDYDDVDPEGPDLSVLGEYVPAPSEADEHRDTGAELYLVDPADAEDPQPAGAVYAVTNPPETVTVSTFLDGRVQQVELSPKVVGMTEADLADEIVVIAGLATMNARSAQYAVMLDGMREHGHSEVATRDFLARDLELPSPEQADARRAEVFSTRYEGSHE